MNDFIVIERRIISKKIVRSINEQDNKIKIVTDDEVIWLRPEDCGNDIKGAMDYLIRAFN